MTKQDFLDGKEFFPLKYTVSFNRKGSESIFGGTLYMGSEYFCAIYKHSEEGFYIGKILFEERFILFSECELKEVENE